MLFQILDDDINCPLLLIILQKLTGINENNVVE